MTTNLAVVETTPNLPTTAKEIQAQVQVIQQVMAAVMKEGTHYGKIPGCGDKDTLLKPGAEKLMATFKLAADPKVEDLSNADEVRYRVTVRMMTFDGRFVGAGIGECSSSEEKYKWRYAVCDEEFDETPEDRRREKWVKKWQKPAYKIKQVRTNPSDVANTILKMAKKRGLVDGVLTATAASDIFAQDLEDMPEELRETATEDHRPAGVRAQEADHPRKAELTKKLEATAGEGWTALQKAWAEMPDEDRKIIGADFGRIKKMVESVK